MTHPTMPASEAVRRAEAFADEMVEEIEAFNTEYPGAIAGDKETWEALREAAHGIIPKPVPIDSRNKFVQLFLSLLAKHYVIVPDVEVET